MPDPIGSYPTPSNYNYENKEVDSKKVEEHLPGHQNYANQEEIPTAILPGAPSSPSVELRKEGPPEIKANSPQAETPQAGMISRLFSSVTSLVMPGSRPPEPMLQAKSHRPTSAYPPEMLKSMFDTLKKGGANINTFKSYALLALNNPMLNREINNIKHGSLGKEFYKSNDSYVNMFSHFSYITQKKDQFNALNQKREALLEKFNKGLPIAEEEKITPEEVHLINSFLDDKVLNFLVGSITEEDKKNPGMKDLAAIVENCQKWKSFIQNNLPNHQKPGDLMFYDGNAYASYHGGNRDLSAAVVPWATTLDMSHASVVVRDPKDNTKNQEIHVCGAFSQDDLDLSHISCAITIRRNDEEMMTEEGKKIAKFLESDAEAIGKLKEGVIKDLVYELSQNQDVQNISNGPVAHVYAFLGEMNLPKDKMPTRDMVCSQFAKYFDDVVNYRLNQRLTKLAEAKVIRNRAQGKPIDPEIQSILDAAKGKSHPWLQPLIPGKSSVVTPGDLMQDIVGQKKGWKEVEPPPLLAAIFQTPKLKNVKGVEISPQTYVSSGERRKRLKEQATATIM